MRTTNSEQSTSNVQEEMMERARVAVWGAVASRRLEVVANTGWTDIARAASLAVRQAKAAARKFFVEGGFAVEAPVQGTDPGPPEHETAKQAAKRAMFEKQAKRAGKDFLGNWYPRGKDGKNADPRIGVSTAEAPYGYVEGTTTPRTEPLYDQFGRPIIPRPKEDWFEPDRWGFGPFGRDEAAPRSEVWLQKVNTAMTKWGPFGDRVKMSEEDGITVTDAEYERYQEDREKAYKKKVRAAEKAAKTGKMPKASKVGKPVYGKDSYEQPVD